MYLAIKNGYKFDELIDNIVGNLIGVLAAFLLFDILYNKLTQDAYARETSQQITKTLMGEPEILDSFSEEDKRNFIKSTMSSMMKDEDAVDMLVANLGKYFDTVKEARIRKSFDYIISLKPQLPVEYEECGFPNIDKYYLIDEEFKFQIKFLSDRVDGYNSEYVNIGFAYDKKSLDAGLLENGQDADFAGCIFNEDLVVEPEVIRFINDIPNDELLNVFGKLFEPILRIDNSNTEDDNLVAVERKDNGVILKFKIDYDYSNTLREHFISIYFKMPRIWNSIFEVTLVDPTKEPHIKMKYEKNMDVIMYSYLNKENESNTGACIRKAGLYDIAIKDEWIYPKSGVVFSVKKKEG